jgi:hypothetical protein
MDPEILKHRVTAGLHSQGLVSSLGAYVAILDVESQADHVGSCQGLLAKVPVKSLEDAPTTKIGVYVHALQPPDPAVAPVAPLAGDSGLADEPRTLRGGQFRDPVAQQIRLGQSACDAPIEDCSFKHFLLCLDRQQAVELDDCRLIG